MRTAPTMITVDEFIHNQKYSFLAIPIWGLAMTFIKISIAMTLLRIQPTVLVWRMLCGLIMFVLAAYGIGNTIFIMLQCRPLEAAWNPSILQFVPGSCLPLSAIMTASNTGAGVNISTDILLSLAPIMFLWKLKRPLREKLVVGGLMGLGLFASASSIIKTLVVAQFTNPNVDGFALGVSTATWTMLEQLLAMIAASAPFLKPLLQSALLSMGFSLNSTGTGGYGPSSYHRATGQSTFNMGTVERGGIRMTRSVSVTRREHEGDESPFAKNVVALGSSNSSEEAVELETKRVQRGPARESPARTEQSLSAGGDTSWYREHASG